MINENIGVGDVDYNLLPSKTYGVPSDLLSQIQLKELTSHLDSKTTLDRLRKDLMDPIKLKKLVSVVKPGIVEIGSAAIELSTNTIQFSTTFIETFDQHDDLVFPNQAGRLMYRQAPGEPVREVSSLFKEMFDRANKTKLKKLLETISFWDLGEILDLNIYFSKIRRFKDYNPQGDYVSFKVCLNYIQGCYDKRDISGMYSIVGIKPVDYGFKREVFLELLTKFFCITILKASTDVKRQEYLSESLEHISLRLSRIKG
jgi:hypothetical protein